MNPGTEAGAIPANVPVKARPIVTAGLANDVDDVAQYAAPTHPATAAGASAPRPDRASAKTTSTSHGVGADRTVADAVTAGSANIRFASTAPAIPPAVCAAA